MNAQKLRNNKIAVSNSTPRKDAIQVIENLRTAEFFSLIKSARNWDKSLNDKRDTMFTTYENEHSKVCKEFDRIFERRRLFEEHKRTFQELQDLQSRNSIRSETKNTVDSSESVRPDVYTSQVVGTSKLIRIPKKQIIKIARRKGSNDSNNKLNSVCIDNRLREEFFKDCKTTQHFDDTKLYELMYNEFDKDVYEKWDSIMKDVYERGLNK